MSANTDNVRSIEDYKKEESGSSYENLSQEIIANTGKDMGKVSMLISILAVILVVVMFYGLNQNVAGLDKEVKALSGLKDEVAALDGRVVGVEEQLAEVPAEMRRVIVVDALNDMAQKLGYMGSQMDEAQAAKLAEAMKLLEQVKTDMGN